MEALLGYFAEVTWLYSQFKDINRPLPAEAEPGALDAFFAAWEARCRADPAVEEAVADLLNLMEEFQPQANVKSKENPPLIEFVKARALACEKKYPFTLSLSIIHLCIYLFIFYLFIYF